MPGIELNVKKFDFSAFIRNEHDLVLRMRREKYEKVLKGLESVRLIEGHAHFVSENEIAVNGEILRAEKLIIATGSTAGVAPIEGIRQTGYLTHIDALRMQRLPERLIIIGAGPVGIEFAQMFSRFGSGVTLLKRSPGILRSAEVELTRRLEEILVSGGIEIITAEDFVNACSTNGKKVVTVSMDGKKAGITGDEILMSTGFKNFRPSNKHLRAFFAGYSQENNQEGTMKKTIVITIAVLFLMMTPSGLMADTGDEIFLVHLKTSLKKDDAQICVAYNIIWAALTTGKTVKVLIDADAINTFKIGWRGKDDIEGYKIPENLRQALAGQFQVDLKNVPATYGDFLIMLKDKGAEFYINSGFLIVSKIGAPDDLLGKVSAKFFKPVTLKEMVQLRTRAKYYMVY